MPRPPDQPRVQEDAAENRAREVKTVGELVAEARAAGEEVTAEIPLEPFDFRAVVARIGPERWAELRRRRDEILAELRRRRDDGG
jgi:hypothetical protein